VTEVQIPFNSIFQLAMTTGRKTCTSRTRQYGRAGDTFRAFGCLFEITKVERRMLKDVALVLHAHEGCQSRREFIEVWGTLHPRKGFVPDQLVWVHWFRRIGEEGKERILAYA